MPFLTSLSLYSPLSAHADEVRTHARTPRMARVRTLPTPHEGRNVR